MNKFVLIVVAGPDSGMVCEDGFEYASAELAQAEADRLNETARANKWSTRYAMQAAQVGMTLEQIKAAVLAGKTVYWSNEGYTVILDSIGQWLIKYAPNAHCIGLTHRDGVTMNGAPEEFYMDGMPQPEDWQTRLEKQIAARRAAKVSLAKPEAITPPAALAGNVASVSNAEVLSNAHAFLKAERLAKYARWAQVKVALAIGNDHATPETIRACAASHLADKLAISDGLTLLQVGEAHTTLAEKLVADVAIYAAGWTGSDTQYFPDAQHARQYIAEGLDEAAKDPVDGANQADVAEWCNLYAKAFRALDGNSSELTLYGVSYFVKKV